MAVIQFVKNFDDLSTDRGYQFKFYCDKCGNGYMSSFQPSFVGTAGSLLRAAGDVFGGVFSSAGNSAYEIQRAVGGKGHDSALSHAAQEGKEHFRQCTRCGKWVCPEVCWNAESNLCEECAPKLTEEMAAAQAQAKVEAARQQLNERAQHADYVGNIDIRETILRAPDIQAEAHGKFCPNCGVQAGSAKFCPNCGFSLMVVKPALCSKCGFQPEGAVKFCPECGNHL